MQVGMVQVVIVKDSGVGAEVVELGDDVPNAGDDVNDYEGGEQEVTDPLDLGGYFKDLFEIYEELALLLHHFKHPHQLC